MKKIHAVVVVLLACMLIGADGCGLSSCKADSEPPPCSDVLIGMGGATGMGGAPLSTGAGGSSNDTGVGGSSSDAETSTCMDGSELGTYVRCRGLDPTACAAQCNAIGASCVELATHPKKPNGGIGNLKQCQSSSPGHVCTYCYANGDVCSFIYGFGRPFWTMCSYTGGKGCD